MSASWIHTADGRMLARSWQPPDERNDLAPIVLLHDSLGCIALWRDFPLLLARATGRQVIAYDRLGFGQSDQRRDKLGPDFVQDEARRFFPQLREQLGFDRFVAFGHSVGGGMAVHCAAMYATSCEALITESAQAFVEDRTRAGILEAKAMFGHGDAFERLRRYHGEKTRWVLDAWIDTWLSPAFADWSLNEVLPQVTCPTLVIHGSEDEYGSRRHPETITRLVGGMARMEIMPGTGHVPHRENGEWVATRVASFIDLAGQTPVFPSGV
jgi:pimeloyl-ACP methyl ester carboxylesterase